MTLPLEHLFFPAEEPSNKLIIVLHGRGDSAEGFRFFPQELGFTDVNYLLLNAPYEYYPGYSWYDLPPNQSQGIHASSEMLTHTLDILFSEQFTPDQTILFGFSQGSLLTFEFGSRYKEVLAGYMAISGYIYDSEKILKEMNPKVNQGQWFCSHGYEDDVLPFEQSQAHVKNLQAGGFKIDFRTYHKPHTIALEEIKDIKQWIASKF